MAHKLTRRVVFGWVLGSFLAGSVLAAPPLKLSSNKRKEDSSESSETEATGSNKKRAERLTYLAFGGVGLTSLNSSGVGMSFSGAQAWDAGVATIKLLGEIDVNGEAFFTNAAIGANYYLAQADVAPYLSGDFGAGLGRRANPESSLGTTSGFTLGLGTGVTLLHTFDIQLDIGFRAAFLLKSTPDGSPAAYSARVGVYF